MNTPVPIYSSFHHTGTLSEERQALCAKLPALNLITESGAARARYWPSVRGKMIEKLNAGASFPVLNAEKRKLGLNLDLRSDVEQLAALGSVARVALPNERLEWYGIKSVFHHLGGTGDPEAMLKEEACDEMRAEVLRDYVDIAAVDGYMVVQSSGVPIGVSLDRVPSGEANTRMYDQGYRRWSSVMYQTLRATKRLYGSCSIWLGDRTISADGSVLVPGTDADRLPPWVVNSMLMFSARCVRAGLAERINLFLGCSNGDGETGVRQPFDWRDEQIVKTAVEVARGA